MTPLTTFEFRRRTRKPKPTCQVIICTKHSGKVRRKEFTSWDDARDYVNQLQGKRKQPRDYRISIEPL